jgi:hypothetical protein
MASNKYTAHYVDLFGVSLAKYVLAAMDDEAAKLEARQLLVIHPSIEVWHGPRWIARFFREEHPRIKGH